MSDHQNFALAGDVLSEVNAQRAARGLGALNANGALTRAAQEYSAYLFSTGDPYALSHTLDGTPSDRALREGYTGLVGEVLVTSPPSASGIVDLWLNSPPHYSIIMGSDYSDVGIGCEERPYTGTDGYTFDIVVCAGDLGIR